MTTKLTHFDILGRGEPLRLALALAGVDFVDHRIQFADFPKLKSSLPFGTLPVLEIDGLVIGQSLAALRYIGRKHGFYSEDPVLAMRTDELMLYLYDIVGKLGAFVLESDMTRKAAMRKSLAEDFLPEAFGRIENLLVRNNNGYLIGETLSIPDLIMYGQMLPWIESGILDGIPKTLAEKYPMIQKNKELVSSNPMIKTWDAKKH